MTLYVDDRYQGTYGIARYAREVASRIPLCWHPLRTYARPFSALDLVAPARLRLKANDVLYNPGFSAGVSRARQILTLHDLIHLKMPTTSSRARKWHQVYYEQVLRPIITSAKHVITVSEATANDLRAWLGDCDVVVHNAGNGCSAVFKAEGPIFEEPCPYFLFVGNLKRHKNAMPVFQAMQLLPEYGLKVVTPDVSSAIELIERHQLTGRAEIHSEVADERLAALYRGSKALVFPSLFEGFGLPVVEALRCRTPVVYFEGCDSVKEICGSTQFGVADPFSATAFANGMMRAASEEPVFPDLGAYDWDQVARRVTAVLEVMADA